MPAKTLIIAPPEIGVPRLGPITAHVVACGEGDAGTTLVVDFTLRAKGGTVTITVLTTGDFQFAISNIVPALPMVLNDGQTGTFRVSVTKPALGDYQTILQIVWDFGITTIHLDAAFSTAGTDFKFTPNNMVFTLTKAGVISTLTLNIANTTAAPHTVNSITCLNPMFTCTASGVVINAGANHDFTIVCDHSELGVVSDWLVINATAISLREVQVTAITVGVVSQNVVVNSPAIVLGFAGILPEAERKLDPTSFDSELATDLVFNGALWNNPGKEKTLRRLELYYINLGECTGLKLRISVYRPTVTPTPFQVITYPLTIGDVTADETERSAFFDTNITGELIIASLQRDLSTGPVMITALVPHFEDKGEKVENV